MIMFGQNRKIFFQKTFYKFHNDITVIIVENNFETTVIPADVRKS